MLRATSTDKLVFRVELFAAHAVQTFVFLQVEISCLSTSPPQPIYADQVAWIATGLYEVVEREIQRCSQPSESFGHSLDVIRCGHTGFMGATYVLECVVVSSGLEPYLLTEESMVAGQDVGLHKLQRVPDMRLPIHVWNCRRDEVAHDAASTPCGIDGLNLTRARQIPTPAGTGPTPPPIERLFDKQPITPQPAQLRPRIPEPERSRPYSGISVGFDAPDPSAARGLHRHHPRSAHLTVACSGIR